MLKVTFQQSAKDFILDTFNKGVDDEGYLVEKGNPTQRVLSRDGQEIRRDKFAGIRKGSEIYINSDIVSLIELCDDLKNGNLTHELDKSA